MPKMNDPLHLPSNPHSTFREAEEAGAITRFRDSYFFLSNFSQHTFWWNGHECPTAEHAYQAAKCLHHRDASRIILLSSAAGAKAAGQKVKVREGWWDWDQAADMPVRVTYMYQILRCKFTQHHHFGDDLREMLLGTWGKWLYEGNDWGDMYWGVVNRKKNGMVGENWLGRVLMQIRDEFFQDEMEREN